ncbi:MAG: DNA alkylation repair protein, partial [Acidobacteriota bacterium]
MNVNQVMAELKSLGTAQNRKIYGRHGVAGEMFGVSYANLGKLEKKLKGRSDLTVPLWETGNHDAQVLGAKLAEPSEIPAKVLDSWVKGLGDHVIVAAFAGLASQTKSADSKNPQCTQATDVGVGSAGCMTLSTRADDDSLPDR